jgi:hypothetical protein
MPSGAAQLPSHRGGRCRHCGAVMDCPAPQTLQPERGSGRPAGGRRRRGRPGCPDAGHGGRRWVRVRCSPCGRTSVQLVGRMSGVQATGVHATGVIRGVRTDTRPVSTAAAAALSGPLLDPGIRRCGGTGHIGAPGWTCRCGRCAAWSSLPESGLAGRDGRTLAVRGSHEGRRQTWTATWYAYRLRRRARCSATMGAGPAPVPVGWRGSRGRSGCSKSPAGAAWAGCRRTGRPWGWTGRW